MRYYWHDICYYFSLEGCQWLLGSPKVMSYPGIQVMMIMMMMMIMTRSVTISPDDVQAEIYCGFVTKCTKHIPRDSSGH